MNLFQQSRKFQNLDAVAIAVEALTETKEAIADLNTEQMHRGLNADGGKIGEYHSELYAEEKFKLNPLAGFGFVDLRLTGAYYQGRYIKIVGDKVVQGSTDPKAQKLEEKYGHLYGLTPQFKREYLNEALRPAFTNKMQVATGLKFGNK